MDNRKENLRHVTKSENTFNHKTKGIFFNKRYQKWEAYTTKNYKTYYLGRYITEQEALNAHSEGEEKYFPGIKYNNQKNLMR